MTGRLVGLLLLAAAPVAASAPAAPVLVAEDGPLTTPTRDVDVTYRAMIEGHPAEQRSRFSIVGRIRIDTPSPGLYMVIDRGRRTMSLVSQGDRSVLDMPYRPDQAVAGVPAGRAFTRLQRDTVSGTPCTEWQTDQPTPVTMCFTDDGVLLRVRSGATVLVQAVRVAYGPIDPAVFSIPSDYRHGQARQ